MKPLSLVFAALFAFILTFGQSAFAVDAVTPAKDRTLNVTVSDARTGQPVTITLPRSQPVVITRNLDIIGANAAALAKVPVNNVPLNTVDDSAAAMVNVANTPNVTRAASTDAHPGAVTNTSLSQLFGVLVGLTLLAAIVYWVSRVGQYRHDHPETIRPDTRIKKDTIVLS